MAPLETIRSRDLAWISEFVREQVVLTVQPFFEHLQETEDAVSEVQLAVHRLGQDFGDLTVDVERTTKLLRVLRQGLGQQNESKCMLQRDVETMSGSVRRLEEQVDDMSEAFPEMEHSIQTLCADLSAATTKLEENTKNNADNVHAIKKLQGKVERMSNDARSMQDSLLSNEAHLESWRNEFSEFQRTQLSSVSQRSKPDAKEPWSVPKSVAVPMDSQKRISRSGRLSPTRSVSCAALGRSVEGHAADTLSHASGSSGGSRLPPLTRSTESREKKDSPRTASLRQRVSDMMGKSPRRGSRPADELC